MTDGDNVQWLVTGFSSPSNPWYGSSSRGKAAIGWTVAPAMAEIAPSVLEKFYRDASVGKDIFVAGPSGVGYTIPDKFSSTPNLQSFANLTGEYCQRGDLKIVNVINDDSDLNSLYPILDRSEVDAVFDYYGGCYAGGGGALNWYNNKPIITGRYAMWGDPDGGCQNNEASLAGKLRLLPKDPSNPSSYSLIPVHVWTHNVSSVLTTIGLLGTDYFDIVTPEEFLNRINKNIFHDCAAASVATGSFSSSCSGCKDQCGVLSGCSCGDGHGGTIKTNYFDHMRCPNNVVNNCWGRLLCSGETCECPGPATGSYSGSCSSCRDVCGLLSGCSCTGGPSGAIANPDFDYSICPNYSVANCFGALICQGQPC